MLKASDSRWKPMRRDGLVRLWLVAVAVCGIAGLTAFLGMDPRSGAAPAPVFKMVPGSPEEIEDLYNDLGDADEGRRERAYERLLKIGPPALLMSESWHRRGAPARQFFRNLRWSNGDPNRIRLSFRLIEEIQKKYGPQTIRDNGLAFTPFGDQVWKIPLAGGKTKLELGVEITNVGTKAVRFCLPGVGLPYMMSETMELVKHGAWGKAMYEHDNYFTPLLQPGDTYRATFRGVELHLGADGKEMWLEGRPFKACWDFGRMGLKKGRYYLSYACGSVHFRQEFGSPPPKALEASHVWIGDVETLYIPVDIE